MNFYLWTDSSVAYFWIVNTSKIFPVFIQNMVKEIRNLVDTTCFKLIDTKRDPADIVSHRVKPAELLSNRLWFSGPEFLTLDKDSWPSLKVGEKFILLSEIESRGNDVCIVTSFAKRLRKIETMTYVCVTSLIERMVTIIIIIIITLFIVDGFQMYKLKCENYNNLQYIYTYIKIHKS